MMSDSTTASRAVVPATLVEAEPLAFARQRIARYRDMYTGGFRLGAGHDLLRNAMKQFAKASPFNLSTLKHCARAGSIDAQEVLKAMAAEELARDGRLRPQLADYAIDLWNSSLVSRRRRGRQKATNFLRDCCFVAVIAEVTFWFKLKPTRNRAARSPPQRPSACAIVAEAIRLELPKGASKTGERGLEQIWGRLAPWYFQQAEQYGPAIAAARRT
jgi:hypothetical protein